MGSNKSFIAVFMIIIGILTASSVYFYLKSQDRLPTATSNPVTNTNSIVNTNTNATSSTPTLTPTPTTVASTLTTPGPSSSRPSNPAMTYSVKAGETLFIIGQKFDMTWTTLTAVNGMTEEDANKVKENQSLIIPIFEPSTKQIIVSYLIDTVKATQIQTSANSDPTNPYLDPVKVAKSDTTPIYNLSSKDDFILKSADEYQGIATVQANHNDVQYLIDLVQPVKKGKEGIWAVSKIHQGE